MKKKLLILLGIITVFMGVFVSDNTYAAARTKSGTGANSCDSSFMGFNAWWNGLGNFMDNNCRIISDENNRIGSEANMPVFVWTIVLNILHDLFAAIGYISIALIIFGGYMYITSGGDPGKSVKARKTLTSAAIGMILVVLATVIVDTVVNIVNAKDPSTDCGTNSVLLSNVKMPNCFNKDEELEISAIFGKIFAKALDAGALMAAGFMVYGGISYVTSNGSPEKAKKALKTLIFSAVGLVIVFAAAIITNFVMSSAGEAVGSTLIINVWKG